jgi:hypothetical protein
MPLILSLIQWGYVGIHPYSKHNREISECCLRIFPDFFLLSGKFGTETQIHNMCHRSSKWKKQKVNSEAVQRNLKKATVLLTPKRIKQGLKRTLKCREIVCRVLNLSKTLRIYYMPKKRWRFWGLYILAKLLYTYVHPLGLIKYRPDDHWK